MKSLKYTIIISAIFVTSLAFAGRPTPKGLSIAHINQVMEQAELGDTILSVRYEATENIYIMEYQKTDEGICRAQGYIVTITSLDEVTGTVTVNATADGLLRTCVINN